MKQIVIIITLVLAFLYLTFVLRNADLQISEFWRGVGFGMCLMVLSNAVTDLFNRTARRPASLDERIDAVIGRWRHAVPAMRELP